MLSEPNANEDSKKNGGRPYRSDGDIKYGWFNVRPGHMQMMLKPVLFIMTLVGCISTQILLGHMLAPVTLVLKRRYLLTDKDITGLTVAQGISTMISVIIVGYLGSFRARKIHFIAVGMALTGLGAIFFAIPHFQTDEYEPKNFPKQALMMFGLCRFSQTPCLDESVESKHMALFVIGQILIGLGQGPLYCLIPAYIDENIKPKSMPMALLPWYGFLSLGPVIGMGAAGIFLQVYIDIDQPKLMHKMDMEDIRWLGAWWLGYIVIGCISIFHAIIIAGFPPLLPGSQSVRDEHILEGNIPTDDGKITQSVSGILHATTSLLKNKAFVFNTLANLCIVFFLFTMGPFILQMVVIKYGADHFKIGMPVMIVLFFGLIVGTIIGAYLTMRIGVKNLAKGAAFLCLATQALCILAPLLFVVPGCNDSNIAGVNKEYPAIGGVPMPKMKENISSELTAQCNKHCACGTVLSQPVCGSNNVAYFDPCHAGCQFRPTEDDYVNCTCIPPSEPGEKYGTAKKGFCDRGCGSWKVFLFVTFLALVIFGTNIVPSKVVVLRCVRNNERSYALAVQTFLYILVAFIPTHLVKHIMDRDCNIWQTDPCGNKGICWDYDTDSMSKSMTIFGLVVTALATTFYFFSWYVYTPPKTMKSNRLLSDTSAAPDNFEDAREPETKL